MNKAFFIDRDGVIVVETDYLGHPDDVEIIPGVAEALKAIKAAGFLAIIVSNQSGVARGYYSESDVELVNHRIVEVLAEQGAVIDAFYHCPHHPKFSGDCDCRKPEPGMLLTAAEDHQIDPAKSYMIGDKISDVEAGRNAGCAESVLIKTGHGINEATGDLKGITVADDFAAAVKKLLNKTK
jgi:D-glycero-D-manno-heptose 1,7-bisphosphate phosphatase